MYGSLDDGTEGSETKGLIEDSPGPGVILVDGEVDDGGDYLQRSVTGSSQVGSEKDETEESGDFEEPWKAVGEVSAMEKLFKFLIWPHWSRIRQFNVLLYKNAVLARRSKKSTTVYILLPVIFNLTMLLLSVILPNSDPVFKNLEHPGVETMAPYPRCSAGKDGGHCYTLCHNRMLNADVVNLTNSIADRNGIPRDEIVRFNTSQDVDDFLFNFPNTTFSCLIFEYAENFTGQLQVIPDNVVVYIQLNQTAPISDDDRHNHWFTPIGAAVDRGLIEYRLRKYGLPPVKRWEIQAVKFPHPRTTSTDVVVLFGYIFIMWACTLPLVIQLTQIVGEKEKLLRFSMRMMGLHDLPYWLSWFFHYGVFFNFVQAILLIASGAACQFRFFLHTSFFLLLFYFLMYGLCVFALAFLLSTIVNRGRSAVLLGFVLFIVVVIFGLLYPLLYEKSKPFWAKCLWSLMAPVVFTKGLGDLVAASDKGATSISWGNYGSYVAHKQFPILIVFRWMILDFFIYIILGWYLDNVLPSPNGITRYPWFFLQPSYWFGFSLWKRRRRPKHGIFPGEDSDVAEERENVAAGKYDNAAIVIAGLKKTFSNKLHTKRFHAVNGVSFHVERGELFSLLGPNGAGKTTIINMLVGQFGQSSGGADIFGYPLSQMDEIRKIMGVCPQHDILWDELSAKQHLRIFAVLKGMPLKAIPKEVRRLLKEVHLSDVGGKRSDAYSGGMKRRLSIGIALVGDPSLLTFDEPSTGLDPVTRRQVWKIIERAKKDRVILMTTHSMEEAEFLSDRITIMCNGRLRCLGTSLHLKNKFGSGYRINVMFREGNASDVKEAILEIVPEARFLGITATTLITEVPRTVTSKMASACEHLRDHLEELQITDFSVSQSTLVEVFLQIAAAARFETKGGGKGERDDDVLVPLLVLHDNELAKEAEDADKDHVQEQKLRRDTAGVPSTVVAEGWASGLPTASSTVVEDVGVASGSGQIDIELEITDKD